MQNEYISFLFLDEHVEHKQKLAQVIRAVRGLFGYSQAEMAKVAKSSRPTLSKIERMEDIETIRHETFERFLRLFADMGVIIHYHKDGTVHIEVTPQALQNVVRNSLEAKATADEKKAKKSKEKELKDEGVDSTG